MISLRSILHFMVHQFTFGLGGGIGEAALIGAAFGGAKALATGQDPLEAALLGGVTGGAMNGIMGAIGGAAPTAAVGTEVAKDATGQALASSLPGTTGVGAFTENAVNAGASAAPIVQQAVEQSSQLANQGLTGLGGMQNVAAYQGAGINAAPASDFVSGSSNGLLSQAPQQTALQVAQGANQYPGFDIRNYINAPEGSTTANALNWVKQNEPMAAGIAGAGYGALTKKPYMPPTITPEKSPLAGYKREQFTPYDAAQPNPYPVASYTGYAEGGIAALANGGQGVGSQGMGNPQSYPGARLDMTQYATPSQMPTSSAVINSGYEMQTNPYTGEPNGFAEGGIASFADGGFAINQATQNNTTPSAGVTTPTAQVYHPSYNPYGTNGMNPYGINGSAYQLMGMNPYGINGMNVLGGTQQQTPTSQLMGMNPYGINGMNVLGGTQQQTPTSAFNAASFNPYNPNQQSGDNNIYHPTYAEGGPVGYSLGGYAAGGNPRLLKGPGDGMSDNIPATIGGKQPARLADGEFVVPADVVSHLGNGSTDAGAKHLYHMMDKVRKARTGRKSQGTQINPTKFLPA